MVLGPGRAGVVVRRQAGGWQGCVGDVVRSCARLVPREVTCCGPAVATGVGGGGGGLDPWRKVAACGLVGVEGEAVRGCGGPGADATPQNTQGVGARGCEEEPRWQQV